MLDKKLNLWYNICEGEEKLYYVIAQEHGISTVWKCLAKESVSQCLEELSGTGVEIIAIIQGKEIDPIQFKIS